MSGFEARHLRYDGALHELLSARTAKPLMRAVRIGARIGEKGGETMRLHPSTHHPSPLVGHGGDRRPSTLSAVRLGVGAFAAMVSAGALYALAHWVGGASATEDNWVALLVALLGGSGLAMSIVAFVHAIRARHDHERWSRLWIPLWVFPAALLFLILGEAFWWE